MPRGKTCANKGYNREKGRAGRPMGSHVSSRGSSSPSSCSHPGATTAQGSSSSYSSYRTDAGHSSALSNSTNPVGNTSHSTYSPCPQTPQRTSQTPQTAQKTSTAELAVSPKTYVDNAKNRKLERVGLEHGTPVNSKNDNSSPIKSSSNHLNESGFCATPQTVQKTSTTELAVSPKTYVDNAKNRKLERVGLEHGTAVHSKNDNSSPIKSSSTHLNESGFGATPQTAQKTSTAELAVSPKTYVNNAKNCKLERVGLEHGSAVNSKNDNSSPIKCSSNHLNESGFGATPQTAQKTSTAELAVSSKTYVDNVKNCKLERVGLEHGTAVHPKNDNSSPIKGSSTHLTESGFGATPQTAQKTRTAALAVSPKTYVDNAKNRNLKRVGLPIGTAVHSRKTGIIEAKEYVDNSKNRSLTRVGLPRGSAPKSLINNNEAEKKPEIHVGTKPHCLNDDFNVDNTWKETELPTFASGSYFEDLEPVLPLYEQTQRRIERKSSPCFDDFEEVNKKDVRLLEKIGEGGFGEVWKAEWKNKIVAVKKLRVQRESKNCLKDFKDEVTLFCTLQHDNIVTFFGACLTIPDVCIVMELMEMSLFEALHEQDEIDFTVKDLLSIMLQTAVGLCYLHDKKIAHCDLKTTNVLLNYFSDEDGSMCYVKITDFGLSIMKSSIETSQSSLKQFPIGTPRYSAPEVLRRELLSGSQMQVADIYSLGMVFYEIIYMKEPFYNMSYQQLCKQVGEKGLAPEIPKAIGVSGDVLDLLQRCWKFDPDQRMTSDQVQREVKNLTNIFE